MTPAHDRRSCPETEVREREKDLCLKPPFMTAVFDRRS